MGNTVSNSVDDYIQKIEDWLEETGLPEYRLGLLSCANNHAVSRIRTGKGSINSLREVLKFIEANPADKFNG